MAYRIDLPVKFPNTHVKINGAFPYMPLVLTVRDASRTYVFKQPPQKIIDFYFEIDYGVVTKKHKHGHVSFCNSYGPGFKVIEIYD